MSNRVRFEPAMEAQLEPVVYRINQTVNKREYRVRRDAKSGDGLWYVFAVAQDKSERRHPKLSGYMTPDAAMMAWFNKATAARRAKEDMAELEAMKRRLADQQAVADRLKRSDIDAVRAAMAPMVDLVGIAGKRSVAIHDSLVISEAQCNVVSGAFKEIEIRGESKRIHCRCREGEVVWSVKRGDSVGYKDVSGEDAREFLMEHIAKMLP